jgi:hypothetical protein
VSRSNRTFLSGAKGRLLPMSVPFRYFGAAVVFHLLAWLALLAGFEGLPRFAGGLGWPLAALHLVTLGVLVMTAIGASLQLLPVATRQPVFSKRGPAAIWWVYTPGVAVTALGMGTAQPWLLGAGAIAVLVALAGYAALLGRNLFGARGMPGVVAHVWTAFASLLVLMLTAFALAFAYVGLPLVERSTALALHAAFAAYGFMGMLSLGLSYILVPMFTLSKAPDERLALVSCALAAVALGLAGVAAFGIETRGLRIGAIALAFVAVGIHLALMRQALRSGLRRALGTSFRLVRTAWSLLVASLVAALLWELDAPVPGMATLFGVVLVAGWLLTFLLGVLQRIAPFLASMHAVPGAGRPPTPSTLTDHRALAVHGCCHGAAVALLALAVLSDNAFVAAVAAAVGAVGGVAYGVFFVGLRHGMAGHLPGTAPPPAA